MATLTETAYLTRKLINIGAILIVVGLTIRLIAGGLFGIWQMIFPPPPPPANMAFGRLPYPAAQNNVATPSAYITYTLETPDGSLPTMPTTFRVYFMPPPNSSFASFDRMKATAGQMGFKDTPMRVQATTWRFTDKDVPLRTLDIDELSQNFRLLYSYISDQAVFSDKNFSTIEDITNSTRYFFDSLGILPPEFKAGTPIMTYYKFDSGALVSTTALANADAVGVTLSRVNIDSGSTFDKIPVVSPDYRQGLVSVLYSGSTNEKKKILEARFLVAPLSLENFGTYTPIKASEAFDRLKAGRAIFASLPAGKIDSVTIRKVYPAYLDPYPSQSYLQPVLVFSDEKGFVAYVPLVNQ